MEGDDAPAVFVSAEGPVMSERVQRELEALRAVAGVTSASAHERKKGEALNKSMFKARVEQHKNPFTVHCSGSVPDLPAAGLAVAKKVAEVLGDDAVAEGRRLAEAAREARLLSAAPPAEEPPSSARQPANAFEYIFRERELQSQLSSANECARRADARVNRSRRFSTRGWRRRRCN